MSTQASTENYIELSSQTYELIVDALATAARSRLDFWKSVFEIAARPYASTALEPVVRENFERAGELSNLTVGELRSRGQRTAEFSEKFLNQVGKLQDAALETFRDSLKSYVSAVNQVKDAATEAATELSPNVLKPSNGSKSKDIVTAAN